MMWSVDLMQSDDSHTQSVMIASGSWDRKIKLWNWQTGECLNTSNTGIKIRTLAVLDTTISAQTSSKKENVYLFKNKISIYRVCFFLKASCSLTTAKFSEISATSTSSDI